TFRCGERTDPAYATGRVRSGPGPRGTAYVGLGLTARRSALVTRDLGELLGLQGGAADECTVDVGLAHQLDHVGGLHAAAVQDAHRIGDRVAVLLAQRLTDRVADLLRVVRAGHFAGADRPDGLVGDDDLRRLLGGEALRPAAELGEGEGHVVAGLALLERLA